MESYTLISVFADGRTIPQVESKTEVLLIQDSKVKVGAICFEENNPNSLCIDHPKNEMELNKEAFASIKEKYPGYLESEQSVILICPKYLAEKMLW